MRARDPSGPHASAVILLRPSLDFTRCSKTHLPEIGLSTHEELVNCRNLVWFSFFSFLPFPIEKYLISVFCWFAVLPRLLKGWILEVP